MNDMGKKRKNINCSRYDIFNYWKDVCIDYQGHIHYEGDYPIDKSIPVVIDWEEQYCFGCGKRIKSSNSYYKLWLKHENYREIWNDNAVDIKLTKAHILADSLGGEPKSRNLFLLCPECHYESPDTTSETMFFKWIYDRRKAKSKYNSYYKEALKILSTDYNLRYPVFDSISSIIKPGVNVTTQFTDIVESSYVGLLVDNALKNKSSLSKKGEKMFENKIRGKIAEMIENNPDDERIDIYKEVLGWYRKAKEFEQTQDLKLP